jgi:hypothetical protein
MGNWETDLDEFLEELRQEEQKAEADKQRVAALVIEYLRETVYPALTAFQEKVEPWGYQVEITPDDEANRPVTADTRRARIVVASGNRRVLESEISVVGAANPDMMNVGATDTNVTDDSLTQQGTPVPQTSTYFFGNMIRDEPPTRDEILNHLVVLFKRGLNHSNG